MAEEQNKKMQKPSYDDLENYARQLTQQAQMMGEQLKKNALGETVARLDFSFKVLDHKDFFNKEYIDKIVEEITRILSVEDEGNTTQNIEQSTSVKKNKKID